MIGRLNLCLGLALALAGLGCSTLRDGPLSVPQDGEDVALPVDATATDEDSWVSPGLDAETMLDVRTSDTSRCPEGQSLCAGVCTDTNASAAHCGGCDRSCPTGRVCVAGACELSCAAGAAACAGTCRDLRRDAMNCGACGQVCVGRNAAAACNAGVCTVGTCNPGAADCDSNVSNGCECAPAHGVPSCPGGRCVVASCEAGYGDCDRDSTNGCEIDLRGTATNCGACGRSCALANAASGCAAGQCTVVRCMTGYGDCDRDPSNGCEATLASDSQNCGACGRSCSSAQYCSGGTCAMLRCDSSEVLIAGGTFLMGTPLDGAGYDDERPQHAVTVSTFCLDRREVMTGEYGFCNVSGAPGCTPAGTAAACNTGVAGRETHPINCVDWNQASAFCRWDRGGRLPTEAEWEYAARGPTNRTYPWGEEAPSSQLCWSGVSSRSSTCVVQSFPSGTFGLFDMGGNVYEWTADWFGRYAPAAAVDPVGPVTGTERVYRGGGAFDTGAIAQRAAFRSFHGAVNFRAANLGFRCAHAPQR